MHTTLYTQVFVCVTLSNPARATSYLINTTKVLSWVMLFQLRTYTMFKAELLKVYRISECVMYIYKFSGLNLHNYYSCNKLANTDLSSLNSMLPNVKAEFLPLLSNMIIQNWQLRLLDVIGEGYYMYIQITSHLCIQPHNG